MSAPARSVRAGARTLVLGERPWLMGIVNASPDSFSDGGRHRGLEAQVGLAASLLQEGADIIDVGGESASTGRPPVAPAEEIALIVPLIERLAGELERYAAEAEAEGILGASEPADDGAGGEPGRAAAAAMPVDLAP